MQDRADPHAREHAIEVALSDPPPRSPLKRRRQPSQTSSTRSVTPVPNVRRNSIGESSRGAYGAPISAGPDPARIPIESPRYWLQQRETLWETPIMREPQEPPSRGPSLVVIGRNGKGE